MNGIEKITDKIIEEANLDAQKVIEAAKKEADKVINTYKEKAAAAAADIEEAGNKQAKAQESKYASVANLEARKTLLLKKQELIAKAFDKALDKLCTLPKDKYVDFLARLIVDAAETGKEEIIFSPKDKGACSNEVVAAANKMLKEKGMSGDVTVSQKTRSISGGVIITRGDVEINCALDGLVRMEKDNLSAQVAQILFS
jgi:V/A-type H+-transporting ATPase subunit E